MLTAQQSTLLIDNFPDDPGARSFCDDFINGKKPRFVLGTNAWAQSIAEYIDLDGFIDEFTEQQEFLGKPIVEMSRIPDDSMVVSAVVLGRPCTAIKKLSDKGICHLDYFRFRKYSGLSVMQVMFQDDFIIDFKSHRDRYDWIYGIFADNESRQVITKIINFRLSSDLLYMQDFTDSQDRQYFEEFLELKSAGESFLDVGSFDGYTSLEFIRLCPNYHTIHVFEPEPKNMETVKQKLAQFQGIFYHEYGLSNCSQTLKFTTQGAGSFVSSNGNIEIKVKRLDDVIQEAFTFLKMDIEGGELFALEGARHSIMQYHPRLAISVYHRFDDLWRIPEQILSIRDDYQVYLRHYTEGATETVMFFIPKQ